MVSIALLILLGACTTAQPKNTVDEASQAVRALGTDEILSRIHALAPKKLNPQECGLFLWMKRQDTPLVYFQRASRASINAEAEMVIDGVLQKLSREETEGLIALSFYERQKFIAGDLTVELKMQADREQSLRQGMKVPSGTLSLKDTNGWSAVLPVAGAIACQ